MYIQKKTTKNCHGWAKTASPAWENHVLGDNWFSEACTTHRPSTNCTASHFYINISSDKHFSEKPAMLKTIHFMCQTECMWHLPMEHGEADAHTGYHDSGVLDILSRTLLLNVMLIKYWKIARMTPSVHYIKSGFVGVIAPISWHAFYVHTEFILVIKRNTKMQPMAPFRGKHDICNFNLHSRWPKGNTFRVQSHSKCDIMSISHRMSISIEQHSQLTVHVVSCCSLLQWRGLDPCEKDESHKQMNAYRKYYMVVLYITAPVSFSLVLLLSYSSTTTKSNE